MLTNIIASNVDASNQYDNFRINTPSTCPHCGFAVSPSILSSHYVVLAESYKDNNFHYRIFVKFICSKCLKAFDSEYSYCYRLIDFSKHTLNPETTYPVYHEKPEHSEHIKNLSERYVKIYNQAYFAEESNLTEICGMGYRKALEFLIKDFAIMLHEDKEEEIKKASLSQCIQNYIDNTRIKNTAKASTWLGNDETHYCRTHEDYSLKELKRFLESTEYFINSELANIEAEKLINAHP